MAIQVLRGNPAAASAASLIVPINTGLVLRGDLGQKLMAAYGPVPQNTLLAKAPAELGTVLPVQVTPNIPGVAARWYCAVQANWQPGLVDTTLHEQAFVAALDQVTAEGQFPCAVPFFLDAPFVQNEPTVQEYVVNLMYKYLSNLTGFFVIADDPNLFNLLYTVFNPNPPAPPVQDPEPIEVTEEVAATDTVSEDTEAAPKKRRSKKEG